MLFYSAAMLLGLVLSAPWWVARMLTTQRYREGMKQRLGGVPQSLRAFVQGKRVVWVHAVSVGEVLAASRLITELQTKLAAGGDADWAVVVSTTTRTGQALAQERFGAERVFYYPLDFAWAVRAYLRVLRPSVLVLMESELWPRMLHECGRAGFPVVVANARVSDRSFARGMRMKAVWERVLRKVSLWLAQSEEDAQRLVAMGAHPESVKVSGNLKYDVRAPKQSRIAERIKELAAGRPIVVAGSTVGSNGNGGLSEEEIMIQAWKGTLRREMKTLLVIAPRHPERFGEVEAVATEFRLVKASDWAHETQSPAWDENKKSCEIVLLDSIGDLAAVYGIADVAFVGGSLVDRGGHNPLEPAQFGVPVLTGPHYQNFRTVVQAMKKNYGIQILADNVLLETVLKDLLIHRPSACAMGNRGRLVFEEQQGATVRSVEELEAIIGRYSRRRNGQAC